MVFSGGLTAMVTVPFSDLSSADLTTSTVVMVFTIQLSNTDIGRVYFPRREASLRTVVKGTQPYSLPFPSLPTSLSSLTPSLVPRPRPPHGGGSGTLRAIFGSFLAREVS